MFENKGINPYDTLAWEISHRYRAKNSYGGYAITTVSYTHLDVYKRQLQFGRSYHVESVPFVPPGYRLT